MPLQMDPSRSRSEDTETVNSNSAPSTGRYNTSEQTTDIVKATQFGLVERCQELLNQGYDVNQRDAENITLLHWAAINCRKAIAKFYIDNGAIVDSVGGELSSTPLHWATRQGHLTIVVLLMKHGADPTVRDGEGCSAIHLAAQFGYTSIVAYLLAKEISPDIQDRGGMTALMWSACRVQSADPTRLLLTFGASTSIQDRLKNNTALHWAIVSRNPIAFALLTSQQTNLDIPNANGDTVFTMLKNMKHFDWISKKTVDKVLKKSEKNKNRQHFFNDYKSDDAFKSCVTAAVPFLFMYGLGLVFSASIAIQWKAVLLFFIYLAFRGISHLICDDHFMAVFPINVYMATKIWMYIVWIIFIKPVVSTMTSIIFFSLSSLLWYNFIWAWRGDPGAIIMTVDERYKTIIELAEEDGFDPKHFCTTCLVRKPLRSKHCAVCDRCVARFDHHCPWLSNCVGYKNHKYFVGFLFSLVLMTTLFVLGALKYWDLKLGNDWSLLQVIMYQPWVTFMTVQAIIHACWVTILLVCQLYQILWLGLTTNERLNWTRYSYFGTGGNGGKRSNGYSKGFLQNCVDFFEIECLHPTKVDWMRTWASTNHDEDNLRYSDSTPFLTDNRDNYQYV